MKYIILKKIILIGAQIIIGESNLMAKAIASEVLESIISSILSLTQIKLEKNTPSTIL